MVVNTVGAEKPLPLPVAERNPGKQEYNEPAFVAASAPPPPYSKVRGGKPRKCCFVTSVTFNFLFIAILAVMGVFLCKYKRENCELEVKYYKLKYSSRGIEYEVCGCEVKPKYRDYVFIEEPMDDAKIEDDDREEEWEDNKWKDRDSKWKGGDNKWRDRRPNRP